MAVILTKGELKSAIEADFSAYDIANIYEVSHTTVYSKMDDFGLRQLYEIKKAFKHDTLKDLARIITYDYLLTLKGNLALKKHDVTLLMYLLKTDGLVEKIFGDDESTEKALDSLLGALTEKREAFKAKNQSKD